MSFSDKFKKIWWGILLVILTVLSVWRFSLGLFTNFDIFLFTFWFILVLFPIISEISLFGINVKKDIENAKNDIKGYINEIKNNNNFQPTINFSATAVDSSEYKEKTLEEVKQAAKTEERTDGQLPNSTEHKIKDDSFFKERVKKIIAVEKLIEKIFRKEYGEKYHSQIKIEDEFSDKKLIIDGAIYDSDKITEIIEIKFITKKSFETFYYNAFNFLRKIFKFGFREPVKIRLIVVSEDIDEDSAKIIENEVIRVNYNRSLGNNSPHIDLEIYKLEKNTLIRLYRADIE